jgi:hypothetical protein
MLVVILEKMWQRSYRIKPRLHFHHQWRAKQAVHQEIVQNKVTSYTNLVTTIEAALVATPNDVNLAEKLINVTEKKSKAEEELLEDPEVELAIALEKKYLHSNAHHTHQEDKHKLSEN